MWWWYLLGCAISLAPVVMLLKKVLWRNQNPLSNCPALTHRGFSPYAASTLAADLPRFARKVVIHLPTQTILPPEDIVLALKDLFVNLSLHVEGRDAMLSVQRDFKTVFAHALAGKTDLDLSKLTQSFLVDHFFRDHLETYRIVRYICQDIVAQAVMMLKQHFSEKAPFKDMRGQWWIHIYFLDDYTVKVVHKKREQARSDEPSDYFEFEWNYAVEFKYNQVANIMLYIDGVSFSENTSAETKRTINELVQKFAPVTYRRR